jgi:hypothetical protein
MFSPKIKRENQNRIIILKNKHIGRRCFIIGNGPSLKADDLEKLYLNNEISFAANRISSIFNQTQWRPTYYSVIDPTIQRKEINMISKTEAELKFLKQSSFIWTRKINGRCLYLNDIIGRRLLKNPIFSSDISKSVYAIATVTYVSMQLAVFMGIKEIYLLGVDNSYKRQEKEDGSIIVNNPIGSYFKGSDVKYDNIPASVWEMNIAYKQAREYAEIHDIKIINATRGGQLNIFPRVDFDTLFKK